MRPQTQSRLSSTAQLPTRSALSVTKHRSKRRPKPTARYRSYVSKGDARMSDYDPFSDDAAVSHPKSPRRSKRLSNIHHDDALFQTSDVQTTAPSSPYDADEEDEGEPHVTLTTGKRKRTNRSLPRSSPTQSRRANCGRKSTENLFDRHAALLPIPHADAFAESHYAPIVPPSQKRSKVGCDTHKLKHEPSELSLTDHVVDGIILWDHMRSRVVSKRVLPCELAQVLQKNRDLSVYVGQDGICFRYPADVLALTNPANQEQWMSELRKPSTKRKVMIIDPKSATLLGPRHCPIPDDLDNFLKRFGKYRSRDARRRVFNAHYTDSLGFTSDVWNSIFSAPPSLTPKTETEQDTAHDSIETHRQQQLPSRVAPTTLSSPTAPSLFPRTSRRTKLVHDEEASFDTAELQSEPDAYHPKRSRKPKRKPPPEFPRCCSSSSSASGPEGLALPAKSARIGSRHQKKILQDIFPTSSSEPERQDLAGFLAPNSSSDESATSKDNRTPVGPVDPNEREYDTVPPSSILILNRTPPFTLQKLYTFQESSASETSHGEGLDGIGFDDDPLFNEADSDDKTQPIRQSLRLQVRTRSPLDAKKIKDMCPSRQQNGTDPLSSHIRFGNFPDITSDKRVVDITKRERGSVPIIVGRPRRRVSGKTLVPSEKSGVKVGYGVTDHQDSLAELSLIRSNDVHAGILLTRISVQKGKQIATNEKLGCKQAAKKEERAEENTPGTLRTNEKFPRSFAHVATISREKRTQRRHSRTKRPTSHSLRQRKRRANHKRSKPNEDHVIVDLNTLSSRNSEAALISEGDGEVVAHHLFPYPSEEVYLWDLEKKKRSNTLIPLGDALERCNGDDMTMIYDGQDIKNGDKRFGEIWSDSNAWISRKGTRPALRRRVRVWDHCTGKIEQFCFSPSMGDVEQWLRTSSNYSLYKPSLYAQYEHRTSAAQNEKQESSVQVRVRRAIKHAVLNRIELLRVTELSEGPQEHVGFWNVLKRKCEPPRSFSSRSQLTRFLFSNPALELFRGQDKVLRLERHTELKLICVNEQCPAKVVTFWDTRLRETCSRPKKGEIERWNTVQECLAAEPELEIYAGQGRADSIEVRKILGSTKCSIALRRPSLPKSWYTLANCGELLQKHVYSEGWVPKYIHTTRENVLQATFWSRTRNAVVMESLKDPSLSVDNYLRETPDLDLYVGQDMPVQVQEQLRWWFQLLQFEAGIERDKAVPSLLRHGHLPLKHRAVRFTTGSEFRGPRKPPKRRRRAARRPSKLEPEDEISRLERRRTAKRQRFSLRMCSRPEDEPNHSLNVQEYSDEDEYLLEDGRFRETDTTKPRSQDTTNYEEENLDGSSGPACTSSLSSSVFDERSSGSCSDADEVCARGVLSMPSSEYPLDAEDPIRSAAKSVKKMTCVIREAGPKVLWRELMHDVRQTLREQLILEVESVKHLRRLVKDFTSHDFAAMANELCEELQLLDVHGCFSCSADFGCSPSDLSSIREDLDSGRICTSEAVIRRFREICGGLMQYHEGTLLHGQASLLRLHGEELIDSFKKHHVRLLEQEHQMVRVFRICERAKQIGFRSGQRNKKANQESTALSLGSSEPSLRGSRRQPEVTFLNYRDEKGNSVMGKRPSVRVFGFTIDTNALEMEIGNIRLCHVCRRTVILSRADALQCSNRAFGICEEVVCRECLETVFSLERNEFKVLRSSENWFCVHCQGLCPSGNDCTRTVVSTKASPVANLRLKFVWPYAHHDAKSVIVVVSKRKLSGEYEQLPENLPEDACRLARDLFSNYWFAFLDLSIGSYRCQIMVDNEWNASSTFQVLPSLADSAAAEQPGKSTSVPPSSVTYPIGPRPLVADPTEKLMARIRPRGPRIRWYSVAKGPARAVHAIRDNSTQDGGTLVNTCSRSEGYDWRRAKRHATLQWVPELQSADERAKPQNVKPQIEEQKTVILCAIDSERTHHVMAENPPKPRIGVSHSDFLIMLNTFRYKEMLKSLWSIVTGRSHIHGIGLFTLSGYKKGDFVIEYAGDLIRTPLADIREARYDAAGLGTYLFKVTEDQIVDATVQSNRARFTNHSCDPNMVADIVHVQGRDLIVLRATREISLYTELTFDYKFPYEEAKVQCLCNSWNCVGVMN